MPKSLGRTLKISERAHRDLRIYAANIYCTRKKIAEDACLFFEKNILGRDYVQDIDLEGWTAPSSAKQKTVNLGTNLSPQCHAILQKTRLERKNYNCSQSTALEICLKYYFKHGVGVEERDDAFSEFSERKVELDGFNSEPIVQSKYCVDLVDFPKSSKTALIDADTFLLCIHDKNSCRKKHGQQLATIFNTLEIVWMPASEIHILRAVVAESFCPLGKEVADRKLNNIDSLGLVVRERCQYNDSILKIMYETKCHAREALFIEEYLQREEKQRPPVIASNQSIQKLFKHYKIPIYSLAIKPVDTKLQKT